MTSLIMAMFLGGWTMPGPTAYPSRFDTLIALRSPLASLRRPVGRPGARVTPKATSTAEPGIPAFPGAEGFGAYARGGRGGRVLYVTTLEDSTPQAGRAVIPGSLRWAIERNSGPRTILFATGGTIFLKADLTLAGEAGSYVTIAGQSAPGDGIQIAGHTLIIGHGAHDVVVRYLRIRPGVTPRDSWRKPSRPGLPAYLEKWDTDALTIYGAQGRTVHDVMVDHCSLEWAIDENVDLCDAVERVTIQHCIIAEGSTFGHYGHPELYPYPHSCGLLAGGEVRASDEYLTVHHNLFMGNQGRNPLLTSNGCTVDFVNNLLYNCGSEAMAVYRTKGVAVAASPHVNVVGNCYIRGPGDSTRIRRMVGLITTRTDSKDAVDDESIYVQDNLDPYRRDTRIDDWEVVYGDNYPQRKPTEPVYRELVRKRRLQPWPTPGIRVTPQPAGSLISSIPLTVGANHPGLDTVDQRLIKELKSGQGQIGFGPQEHYNIHPRLQPGKPVRDSDMDGMPDAYERGIGLDPNNPSDAGQDTKGDGYTNLERYLNNLVATSRPS
jgi:pectate lyase